MLKELGVQVRGSYRSIAETHGAGFAFPQVQEVSRLVLVRGADTGAVPTADFTRRVCF